MGLRRGLSSLLSLLLVILAVTEAQVLFNLAIPTALERVGGAHQQQQLDSTDDHQHCYTVCTQKYSGSEELSDACRRGCRLFTIQLNNNQQQQQLDQHHQQCRTNCETAYKAADQLTACRLGCDTQLSTVQQNHETDHLAAGDGTMSVRRRVVMVQGTGDHGTEVRRSQSSVVLDDGNGHIRVISGPEVVSVLNHGQPDSQLPAMPAGVSSVMQHMHDAMRRLMVQMGFAPPPPPTDDQRDTGDARVTSGDAPPPPTTTVTRPSIIDQLMRQNADNGRVMVLHRGSPYPGGFESHRATEPLSTATGRSSHFLHCLRRMVPHMLLSAALITLSTLVLYMCYLLVLGVRRRRRGRSGTGRCHGNPGRSDSCSQLGLITSEDMCGELPPKYIPQHLIERDGKQTPPPAYAAVAVTDEKQKEVV